MTTTSKTRLEAFREEILILAALAEIEVAEQNLALEALSDLSVTEPVAL